MEKPESRGVAAGETTQTAQPPPAQKLIVKVPIEETRDVDHFRARMTWYGAASADVPDARGFRASGLYLQLNKIGLLYAILSKSAVVEFSESNFARQLLVLKGRATASDERRSLALDTTLTGISSPYYGSRFECSDDYAHLVLRLDRAELEAQLHFILGEQPRQLIEFDQPASLSDPGVRQHCDLVMFLARQCFTGNVQHPELVLRELEQAVVLSFLYRMQHNFSDQLRRLERNIGPKHLRLAEEFIEANWQSAITISSLVDVTGVNARALFRAFAKVRGTTPIAFAKQIRLKRAHEMLKSAESGPSVSEVAMACGFGSLGHFARDYRKAFGELPSQTAGRRRR